MRSVLRVDRRWIASAASLLVALAAASARGEESPRLTLLWHAPAECPPREAVVARVEQLLGERGSEPSGAPLDVREFVTLLPDGGFRAEVVTVQAGVERSRVLDATTCGDLAEASAVVLALAIAPDSEPSVTMPPLDPPQPSAPPAQPPSAQPRDEAVQPHSRAAARAEAVLPYVGAGIVADLGALAPLAPGVSLAGGLRYGRYLTLGLRGSFFPPRESSLANEPNEGVRLLLAEITPSVCVNPLELSVELAGCVEVAAGYIGAEGFGPPLHYQRSAWWLAPGVGLTAAYPAQARFRGRFTADALFPLARTEFVLTNAGVARQLPLVAPRLGLYLELVFL